MVNVVLYTHIVLLPYASTKCAHVEVAVVHRNVAFPPFWTATEYTKRPPNLTVCRALISSSCRRLISAGLG
ncbi:hypothetical protein F4782DRAFT_493973 [Xylaria castorea]|nr:hypothetical protein F4782DRAFT_493973 [Xylaria castorea]